MEKYGNINNLLNELAGDARAEAARILKEAEEYRNNKAQQTERDMQIRKKRILDEAERKAEKIKKGGLSNIKLAMKRIRLKKQEESISGVLSRIDRAVEKIREDRRYPALLLRLTAEIIDVLHEKDIELIFGKNDETLVNGPFFSEMEELYRKHGLALAKERIRFDGKIANGVIGHLRAKNLFYNNTLKAILRRKRDEMAYAVFRELFPEDEKE